MQELLFGSNSSGGGGGSIKPSSNSAFVKYIPSTSDINTKMNACKTASLDGVVSPRRTEDSSLKGLILAQNNNNNSNNQHVNFSPVVQTSSASRHVGSGSSNASSSSSSLAALGSSSSSRAKSPKVARFCHECGNPFALPNIRFCCECGVKRLYC